MGFPRLSPGSAHPTLSSRPATARGNGASDVSDDNPQADAYKSAGVDIAEADAGLRNIVRRITATWPPGGPDGGIGAVQLPIGFYANVIDIGGGIGLALCTDGAGSKAIVAGMMRKYDTIGIDCVAMSVNDLLCVAATPLSLGDY